MNEHTFNQFVKAGPITKAFNFEIIPEGKTRETIENLGLLDDDAHFRECTKAAAPYIDAVVRNIADKALSKLDYDFNKLASVKDDKKKREKEEIALEKAIARCVKENLPTDMKSTKDIMSAAFLSTVLPEEIKKVPALTTEEKDKAGVLFEELKGKTQLLTKFLQTRVIALNTWLPQRVIENFYRYTDNFDTINNIISEKLPAENIEELPSMLLPSYYSQFVTQEGINAYNLHISGIYTEDKVVMQGLNEIINIHNQVAKKNGKAQIAKMKPLYKQILMPSEKSFTIEALSSDKDCVDVVRRALAQVDNAESLVNHIAKARTESMVVRGSRLHGLSYIGLGSHAELPNSILEIKTEEFLAEHKKLTKKGERELNGIAAKVRSSTYSLDYIEKVAPGITASYKEEVSDTMKLLKELAVSTERVISDPSNISTSKTALKTIKDFFDTFTELRTMVGIVGRSDNKMGENDFYNRYDELNASLTVTWKAENLFRNYVTRKPVDAHAKTETVLGTALRKTSSWWKKGDLLKVPSQLMTCEDGKYYYYLPLPVSIGGRNIDPQGKDDSCMLMSQIKVQDAVKWIPAQTFTKAKKYFAENQCKDTYTIEEKVHEPVTITREVSEIYERKLHTKGALQNGEETEEEYRKNLLAVLNVIDTFARNYVLYDSFEIKTKPIEEYEDAKQYYDELNLCLTPVIEWVTGNKRLLDEGVANGSLLKFLIHSRNLYAPAEYTEARKTSYTKMLSFILSPANKGQITLNSRPVLMYRPAVISEERIVKHKKGSILVSKNTTRGEHIPDEIYNELKLYFNQNKPLSDEGAQYFNAHKNEISHHKAETTIIKDKRYTMEKFFLNMSYKKNADTIESKTLSYDLNKKMKAYAAAGCNVLSVIRSRNDLVYVSVVDQNNNVLEERSLNVIDGVDFAGRIREAAQIKQKDKAENWKYDRKIKDLKTGFISKAISEIVSLAVKYEAVICIEYLSQNFKDKYSALDDTVYKSFETALVSRLSDLWFKNIDEGKAGSMSNPLQLATNNGNSFQDGILFYTGQKYIKKTDPETGYTDLFDTRFVTTITNKKSFFSKFSSIRYNAETKKIDMEFDYGNFRTFALTSKTKWKISIGGEGTIYQREQKCNVYEPQVSKILVLAMEQSGVALTSDLSDLARNGELPNNVTNALWDVFTITRTGIVKAHNNKPAVFISPVTGKKYLASHVAALNLAKKFRIELVEGRKEEWIDYVQV